MNLFGLFGSTLSGTAKIPTFKQGDGQDSIDLQVKSLLYIFRRLRINKLSSFLSQDGSFKYIDNASTVDNNETQNYFQKLDNMYNIKKFEKFMANDEYRVMIDFVKNKFRSYCILSDYPSASLARGGTSSKWLSAGDASGDNGKFPSFSDFKDRTVKNFRFIILPVKDVSIEFIASTLSTSDIYYEHSIGFGTRYQYAMEAINKTIKDKRKDSTTKLIVISEDEKALIIREYLITLAFNIQLIRICEEYLKQYPIVTTSPTKPKILKTSKSIPNLNTTFNNEMEKLSISSSPTKSSKLSSSPPKLSSRKSTADIRSFRPSSPTKTLKTKPSISKVKLKELYNPVTSPPLYDPFNDSNKSDASTTTSFSKEVSNEIRSEIYEKCKSAIKEKLVKEKMKLVH